MCKRSFIVELCGISVGAFLGEQRASHPIGLTGWLAGWLAGGHEFAIATDEQPRFDLFSLKLYDLWSRRLLVVHLLTRCGALSVNNNSND
jgi:hypothetical protein